MGAKCYGLGPFKPQAIRAADKVINAPSGSSTTRPTPRKSVSSPSQGSNLFETDGQRGNRGGANQTP